MHHSILPSRPVRRWVYYVGVAAHGVALGVVTATIALETGGSLAMFVGMVGLLVISMDVWSVRRPEAIATSDAVH